jgi:hypothetical protein
MAFASFFNYDEDEESEALGKSENKTGSAGWYLYLAT